jgi:sugar lactone lactonase YvrE
MTRVLVLTLAALGCGGHAPTHAPPFTSGVSTLAGAGDPGLVDGDRDVARFHNPVNVAVAPDGRVFVTDYDNDALRTVDHDGTTATALKTATFARPFGLAFAGDALYISTDADQNGVKDQPPAAMTGSIWRMDLATNQVTIVANAIGRPRGIAVLSDGRIATADYVHHVVSLVDAATGAVTTLAGTWDSPGFADDIGAAARFSSPYSLVQRADGQLVVVDYENAKLRVVGLDGTVSTLAGGVAGFQDGPIGASAFDHPESIAITSSGDLYVTDTNNYRIRRIRGSMVETVAGDGTAGYIDDDDPLASELYGLEGIASDGTMLFVADGTRGDDVPFNRIRQVDLSP